MAESHHVDRVDTIASAKGFSCLDGGNVGVNVMLRHGVGAEVTTRGQQAAVTRYGCERVEFFEGCLAAGTVHRVRWHASLR